ncbi:unnamed protein product [Dicrocoelium dendriticum]|nr:unnamed protein product [Dicrocoelium dendriticum]
MRAESILEPLYKKLSTFSELCATNCGPKSRSKSPTAILSSLNEFIKSVEHHCAFISGENSALQTEIRVALTDVLDTGKLFHTSVSHFTNVPTDISVHEEVHRAGTALLSSLSRLLILAELADVTAIDGLLQQFADSIKHVVEASSSKACLHHPRHLAAQTAKHFASQSLYDALFSIQLMLDDNQKSSNVRLRVSGGLLNEIEGFENSILMDVENFDDNRARAQLENCLKGLLPSVYRLADAPLTQASQKDTVYSQCMQLRQALNSLLAEYGQKPIVRSSLDSAIQRLFNVTGRLKQLLVRIAIDHTTQTLLERDQRLMAVGDATQFGNEKLMDSACQHLQDHSAAMVAGAYELCSLTSNEDSSWLAQLACSQLEQLCPQVISTAYLLFKYPHSKSVEATFEAFQTAYRNAMQILYSSLSELTNVHDFLALMDDQMTCDFEQSLQALSERREDGLRQTSFSMQRRASHTCELVSRKVAARASDSHYSAHVLEQVTALQDKYTPHFIEVSRDALSRLAANQPPDEMRFKAAGRNLCQALHTMRLVVLNETGLPSDFEALRSHESSSRLHYPSGASDIVRLPVSQRERFTPFDHRDTAPLTTPVSPATTTHFSQENQQSERQTSFAMPIDQEHESLAQEFAGFLEEKKRFMREVIKWDDSANEIVVLAKKMCVIMMEMTDFTRGKGPLHSTMEVIQAAQQISHLGERLDQLCRNIADICPDSASRRDLLAYLQRIILHCHQLNITSRVKAGIHATRNEAVDNATALIQAAKNLMTAVVLTVKESYIVSTKCHVPNRQPIVHWRMHAPIKKPLVEPDLSATEDSPLARCGVAGNSINQSDPLNELSQFDHMAIS